MAHLVNRKYINLITFIQNIKTYLKLISKDNYDIYNVCDNYSEFKCSTSSLETIPDNKLVTVNSEESFNQNSKKIIEKLNIQELSRDLDEFFFVKVFNKKGDKYMLFFLTKQQAGASAATSAFYKKKSMKKKSMKKKF